MRVRGLWVYLQSSLWALPTVFVVVAIALGSVLVRVRLRGDGLVAGLVFQGGAEGARTVLSAIAGAMITVTGLTFSLTIVALQMASSQFSPRVLRGFLSDRGNQFVLSLLLATFAYSLAVLRSIVDAGDGASGVPRLAVSVGFLLSLAAVGALAYFLHHLSRQLRVQTIMAAIVGDTMRSIRAVHPDDAPTDDAAPEPPADAHRVLARRSGYLQAVERDGLVRGAAERGVLVRLRPGVGTHVTERTTLAWVWPPGADDDEEALDRLVHDHLHLGAERTPQQDVAFGLRQLVDIAVRALSPGVNDPTTAVDALGHLADVCCSLAGRSLGAWVGRDADGTARVLLPQPGFRDYLALTCDQIRRYGREEPAVLRALLSLLTDTAEVARGDEERAAVRDEVARTTDVAAGALDAVDLTQVRAAAELVHEALDRERRPDPRSWAG